MFDNLDEDRISLLEEFGELFGVTFGECDRCGEIGFIVEIPIVPVELCSSCISELADKLLELKKSLDRALSEYKRGQKRGNLEKYMEILAAEL